MSVPAHLERPQSPMRRTRRSDHAWRWAAVLLLGLIGSIGCNPIQMMSFIAYPVSENNQAPKLCSLAIDGKESKVLILAAHEDIVPNLAFRDAHRELSRRLAQLLEQRYKEGDEKIKIVPVSQVLNYMDNHEHWITESKKDLGKRFGADYVIFLELGPMTLYEKGSHLTLYRGNVEVHISVFDVHQADGEAMIHREVYSCTYPTSGPEDAINGISAPGFKLKFMDRVAKDLVQYFAAHPSRDKVDSE
jgi:hypothetical protein